MGKIIKAFLSSVLVFTMLGCGSSPNTTSETTEEAAKEPKLSEIELTDDNWQEYFEIKKVLLPHSEDEFYEDGDYYGSYAETLFLKDEYKSKLSEEDASVITLTVEYKKGIFSASLKGDQLEIGEELNDNSDLFYQNGWDQESINMVLNALGETTTNTYTVTNEEMISGKKIETLVLRRKIYYPDGEESGNWIQLGGDENVWGVNGIKEMKISDVKGTIVLKMD